LRKRKVTFHQLLLAMQTLGVMSQGHGLTPTPCPLADKRMQVV
jgi:hypothetical protein